MSSNPTFASGLQTIQSNEDIDFVHKVFNDPRVLTCHGLTGGLSRDFFLEATDGEVTEMGYWWLFKALIQGRWTRVGIGAINPWMPNKTTAEVALSIDPLYWRQGWGKELLRHLEFLAKARGFNYLWAGVIESNTASKALFHSMGYKHHAVIPFYAPPTPGTETLQSRHMFVKEI